MLKWYYILFIVVIFFHSAWCGEKKILLDSLTVKNGQLRLSYHVENLLDNKIQEGLQKGFTSEIIHHICLWKNKKVISSIINEIVYPVKVFYDDWQNKYAITTVRENRLTVHIETVNEMCSGLKDFSLGDTVNIEVGSTYYVTIQVKIQPISNETYQELSDWISGSSADNPQRPKKSKPGRFTGMLMDMMGLGDRTLLLKSKDFIIFKKQRIEFTE
jgi:hypothetical protein